VTCLAAPGRPLARSSSTHCAAREDSDIAVNCEVFRRRILRRPTAVPEFACAAARGSPLTQGAPWRRPNPCLVEPPSIISNAPIALAVNTLPPKPPQYPPGLLPLHTPATTPDCPLPSPSLASKTNIAALVGCLLVGRAIPPAVRSRPGPRLASLRRSDDDCLLTQQTTVRSSLVPTATSRCLSATRETVSPRIVPASGL
jgi:hypothetical protein